MARICTGCAVLLAEDNLDSFCSKECQYEFEFTEAYCNHTYKMLDAGLYGAFDDYWATQRCDDALFGVPKGK